MAGASSTPCCAPAVPTLLALTHSPTHPLTHSPTPCAQALMRAALRFVLLLRLADLVSTSTCTATSDTCCDLEDLGVKYCYEIPGTTAYYCASYYKLSGVNTWRFCAWDGAVSKCRSEGVKTTTEPECVESASPSSPAPPVECMIALSMGVWCKSVTDMDTFTKSFAKFEYQGETRYRGCAVVGDTCKGRGQKFGGTMPLTCSPEDVCDGALDTVEAATQKCAEGGECDFTSFAALTDACDVPARAPRHLVRGPP